MLQPAGNESISEPENPVCSEDEDLSKSSDNEPPDVYTFGDETMVDDGIADADVRDSIVNVAPGEGQHLLCLYLDKDAKEMANPDIFGGYARPNNKYSYKQLCRVELRHVNRSVACRPCNISFKFRKLQVLDMKQLSWVRLRKSKLQGRPLPKAEQLANPEGKRTLMEANIGFRDFKQLRGTSDYDEQGKKEAFAMLRQLGPFTIFYTFSMADMKWPEFLRCLYKLAEGKDISLEDAARLPWKIKASLVRTDPVTSSRYHQHRMESLLAIMKKYHSLSGEIVDYFWRDEFQQRGTPHTHMAVYIKDAPILGVQSDASICEFAYQYVTTSGEGLSAENLEAQHHSKHSKMYCLRKCDQGKASYCRFGFPKLPMLETTIIRHLPADTATEDRNKYRAIYERIRIGVQRIDDEQR
jgi:hypothetical protein